MKSSQSFSESILVAIRDNKMLGVRAGSGPHRFTRVWAVVVKGRVFVRSWNDKSSGWHRAFLEETRGAIQILGREISVRARRTTGERLMDAIDVAYGEKYHTPASRKWVRGLALPRRRLTTTELIPL